MATDFSYGEKQIVSGGPFKPSGKDMPSDARTRVECYADIATIPNPHVGLKITVKVDETNNNKMTDYIVKSLKANSAGIANMLIDEVVRYVDYLGASSGGSVSQEDINTAVNNYLTEHPVAGGATTEQAAQIEANRVAIGDENNGLIKEVNNIKNTELQNLNSTIQNLETLIGDRTGLPSGDANTIASINRINEKSEQNKNDIADIINNKLDGKTFKFLTQAEYDVLPESEKNNETIEYHITDAPENSHTHTNKEVLDKISENAEGSLLFNGNKITSDVTENSHTHTNKEVLDKISEDTDGSLLFNGNKITSNSTSGGITTVKYENLSTELQSLFVVIK